MMVNTVGKVRYDKLLNLGKLLCEIVQKADKVEVLQSGRNPSRRLQSGKEDPTIRESWLTQKGEPIMLGGQISWCPMEETIQGKLVFDGALWPPAELGKLRSPVELTVKSGVVTEIHGGVRGKDLRAVAPEFQ